MQSTYLIYGRGEDPFYWPEEKRKMRKKEEETRKKNRDKRKKRSKTFGRLK